MYIRAVRSAPAPLALLAVVTAPNPAFFGWSLFGSSVPSARYCELRIVWSVGLVNEIVEFRLVKVTMLNVLNVSNSMLNFFPHANLKLRDKRESITLLKQPCITLRPDSRPRLL